MSPCDICRHVAPMSPFNIKKKYLLGTSLGVLSWGDGSIINHGGEVLSERLSLAEQTVVFVGRFGQAHHVGVGGDRLLVGHNWVGFLQFEGF